MLESSNRKKNTVRNVYVDMISYFVSIILRFVVRFIFINKIGTEYLGLNSVFTSIISMFSLAELGFNLTVGVMLYKPLADDDKEKIKSFIKLTKNIFTIVGLIVFVGGCAVIPFLQHFVANTTIQIGNIRLYYFLHVLASSISYLNTHKVVLVSADQKQYVYKRIVVLSNLLMSLCQIALMFIFENYISFVLAQLVFTIIQNFVVTICMDRRYPYLKEKNVQKLTKDEKKEFYKQSFGGFFYKLGSIIVSATDSILISSSAILGVIILGKYSNYTLIFTSITQLAYICVSGATASIGNLWVTADQSKVKDVFRKLNFIQFWISVFCTACLCSLSQPVIYELGNLLHEDLMLDISIVIVLSMNFYLQTMQTIVNLFKNAKGLFWHDRYKAIIEAAVNLIASLILMKFMGILGVLIGTTISIIFVNVWYEPRVLYKHGFGEKSITKYMLEYCLYLIMAILICLLTFVVTSLLPLGIGWLCLKFLIAFIIPNLIIILVFRKTDRFKYFTNFLGSMLRKKKKNESLDETKNQLLSEELTGEISEYNEAQINENNIEKVRQVNK